MNFRPFAGFLAYTLCIFLPSGAVAGTSNSLLDVSPDGALVLAANPDNGTVTVVDGAARKALREVPVGEKVESVTWIGKGPMAAAAVYREDKVVFFNAQTGEVVQQQHRTAAPREVMLQ